MLENDLYVVIFPDAEVDFFLGGVFTNPDAAHKCAKDPGYEHRGVVFVIRPKFAQSEYVSQFEKEI